MKLERVREIGLEERKKEMTNNAKEIERENVREGEIER